MAINGGANAGLMAAKILAVSDDALLLKLKNYKEGLKDKVVAKKEKLEQIGYRDYLKQM